VNVYFEEIGNAGIIFRHTSDNSFYALDMNYPGKRSLRLFKKADGEVDDLFTLDF